MAPRNTRVAPDTQVRSPARSFVQSLDNFYQASARDRRSEQATQQGIHAFSAILGEQAARMKEQQREDEYSQGVADAMREQAGEEMKGVRTGSLFRQHSSFYMAGLNEQRGKAAGVRFRDEIAAKYAAWEGKNSDDPNDFRNFMNQHSGEFLKSLESNPQMLNAALPYVNQVASNTALQHTTYTNDRLKMEQTEASMTVFADIISGSARGDYDEQAAVDALAAEVDELYNSGEVNARDIMINAVIASAGANNSMEGFAVLAAAVDQGKIKLNPIQEDKLGDAVDALEAEIMDRDSRRAGQEKDEYDAMVGARVNEFTQMLLEDPRADAREFYKATGIQDEGLFRKLRTVQEAMQAAESNSGDTDAEVEFNFQRELAEAAGDFNKRMEVLQKYARMPNGLTSSQMKEYFNETLEIASGSVVYESKHVKTLRDGYISNIGVIEGGVFSTDSSGAAQVYAEAAYNSEMLRETRGIDPRDYGALQEAHDRAIARVNQQLVRKYPGFVDNAVNEPDLAGNVQQSGADTAIREDIQRQMQEAEQAAAAAQTQQTITAEDQAMDQAVEVMDPDVEDQASTTNADIIRQKPDSFYEEIMQRFTDGTDDRENVSPSVLVETAKRVLGADENAQRGLLMNFLSEGGVNLDPAQTAWCAGFINAVLKKNGIEGTGRLNARSFLDWGDEVPDGQIQEGDIVVFSRGRRDGWQGHVGIFQGYDANGNIRVLGGNQSNSVNIQTYKASDFLGARRAPGYEGTAGTLQALAAGEVTQTEAPEPDDRPHSRRPNRN